MLDYKLLFYVFYKKLKTHQDRGHSTVTSWVFWKYLALWSVCECVKGVCVCICYYLIVFALSPPKQYTYPGTFSNFHNPLVIHTNYFKIKSSYHKIYCWIINSFQVCNPTYWLFHRTYNSISHLSSVKWRL